MIFYRAYSRPLALTFDLDDTLYDNHPHMVIANQKLAQFMSQYIPNQAPLADDFWSTHKRKVTKLMPVLKHDVGMLRRLTLQSGFTELGLQGEKLNQAVTQSFDYFYQVRSDFHVTDEVKAILSELAKRVPLVAITNGNVDLEKIGLSPYFAECFHASAAQFSKPDTVMFQKAAQFLKLEASKILHVGDNLVNDILGARRAGFQSAWLAVNREMQMSSEKMSVLPDVQLASLEELLHLV